MAKFDIRQVKSPGRPKGSKNKAYLTLDYWYAELMKDWDALKPGQRAKLSKEIMQMLTNKIKNLPGSPEQSVVNAKEAQQLLSEMSGEDVKGKQTDQSKDVSEPSNPTPPEIIVY